MSGHDVTAQNLHQRITALSEEEQLKSVRRAAKEQFIPEFIREYDELISLSHRVGVNKEDAFSRIRALINKYDAHTWSTTDVSFANMRRTLSATSLVLRADLDKQAKIKQWVLVKPALQDTYVKINSYNGTYPREELEGIYADLKRIKTEAESFQSVFTNEERSAYDSACSTLNIVSRLLREYRAVLQREREKADNIARAQCIDELKIKLRDQLSKGLLVEAYATLKAMSRRASEITHSSDITQPYKQRDYFTESARILKAAIGAQAQRARTRSAALAADVIDRAVIIYTDQPNIDQPQKSLLIRHNARLLAGMTEAFRHNWLNFDQRTAEDYSDLLSRLVNHLAGSFDQTYFWQRVGQAILAWSWPALRMKKARSPYVTGELATIISTYQSPAQYEPIKLPILADSVAQSATSPVLEQANFQFPMPFLLSRVGGVPPTPVPTPVRTGPPPLPQKPQASSAEDEETGFQPTRAQGPAI